jgi:hypothetical protein
MKAKLMGGLLAVCLFAFNVSESKAQTNPGTNCRSMEEAVAYLEKTHGELNVNAAYEYLLRIFGVQNPEIMRKPL